MLCMCKLGDTYTKQSLVHTFNVCVDSGTRDTLWIPFTSVWCGVVWCGVVWCGVVWCGVVSLCMHGLLTPRLERFVILSVCFVYSILHLTIVAHSMADRVDVSCLCITDTPHNIPHCTTHIHTQSPLSMARKRRKVDDESQCSTTSEESDIDTYKGMLHILAQFS